MACPWQANGCGRGYCSTSFGEAETSASPKLVAFAGFDRVGVEGLGVAAQQAGPGSTRVPFLDDEQEKNVSVIYDAIMNPTKNELIAAWLPRQEWFQGAHEPVLETVGGFRLDDPADKVGMEFIVVEDRAPRKPVIYHVPVTYRGAELPGGEAALLGTSEHSVLGTRWIYDGPEDPVWQEQVRAFLAGKVQAQHQNDSHTLEPMVTVGLPSDGDAAILGGPGLESPEARVIRRLVAGGTASSGASAWVASSWLETGRPVRGAVIEFS